MAKSILPFSFCMKGQTSPELEWDDSKFNEFTEQIGPNWKEQDYALTSNDNITYAISLLSNIDNTHLLLKFHSDTLPKVQISKLFWNDFTVNNCQQKIQFIRQESIQAYKAPKNHDDYHQIFLIDEIWDFVNNEEK